MRKQKTADSAAVKAPAPWQIPVAVEDVPETGRHFDLVADEPVRAAVAQVAGLRELPHLEAHFDLTLHGAGGLHITGVVSATAGQTCVVTLDPVANQVEEKVDLVFVPRQTPVAAPADADDDGKEPRDVKWGDPEPLIGGAVDLGVLAAEFLILGLDPYPRKPGAVFDPPAEHKPGDGPFAALAKLKG